MSQLHYFENSVSRDFYQLFCGDLVGEGQDRKVYKSGLTMLDGHVIKIETGIKCFQNVQEWIVWNRWKDDAEVSLWLAPCVEISPCGVVLIQKETRSLRPDEYPKKIPEWAADVKKENWSWYDGRPVMHDYGHIASVVRHVMKKAVWI